MRRTRPLAALAAALCAAALAVAGCGQTGEEKAFAGGEQSAREGIAVEVDGIEYTVFITRQLNLSDPEDREYFKGPEAPPGEAYYGVFLLACNPSEDETRQPVRRFEIVDSRKVRFEPVELDPRESVFAYDPRPIAPRECIPDRASATSYGPTGGSMLLFRVPLEATEARPFELEFKSRPDLMRGGQRKTAKIELDI